MFSQRWIPLLRRLKLNRSEQAVVERFQLDPHGRSFLPVADLLRNHDLHEESLELLSEGVERHPTFTVARVVLARELLNKGMVAEAWQILERSTESLVENVLASKLKLKLAVLLNKPREAKEINEQLRLRRMYDDETQNIGESIRIGQFKTARNQLIHTLKMQGIPLLIDEDSLAVDDEGQLPPESPLQGGDPKAFDVSRIEGFYVVPVHELFIGEKTMSEEAVTRKLGPELDSTTLASIYEKQGHYSKALEIYERLLKLAPNSDFLRRKVAETTRLKREQRSADQQVDPEFVERLEQVGILDRQLKYLHILLGRLDERH